MSTPKETRKVIRAARRKARRAGRGARGVALPLGKLRQLALRAVRAVAGEALAGRDKLEEAIDHVEDQVEAWLVEVIELGDRPLAQAIEEVLEAIAIAGTRAIIRGLVQEAFEAARAAGEV